MLLAFVVMNPVLLIIFSGLKTYFKQGLAKSFALAASKAFYAFLGIVFSSRRLCCWVFELSLVSYVALRTNQPVSFSSHLFQHCLELPHSGNKKVSGEITLLSHKW